MMGIKKDKIRLIILFFFLLPLMKFCYLLDYDIYKNKAETKVVGANEEKLFSVNFGNNNIPNYLKIQVTSDDNNNAPFLCFLYIDNICASRNQITINQNEKTLFMWIKREEFIYDDKGLIIYVRCEQKSCDYTLTVEGNEMAIFSPNFVYSYLVGKYSKEMNFKVKGAEKNVYMTVALEGSSKANINIDNISSDKFYYRTGSTTTFFIQSIQDISITINEAENGEYLTLSVHLVNNILPYEGLAQNGYLLPNGAEITGYLQLNIINKECFPLDLSNNEYKSISQLYLTGRIHTKYAWFYIEDEHRNKFEESYIKIIDGQLSFVMENNLKKNYVCFELSNDDIFNPYHAAFSFSLSEPSKFSSKFYYSPPQIMGEIYRRIIPKGTITFFSGYIYDKTSKIYNLYQRKGLTKMYIDDCSKYPDCYYSKWGLVQLIAVKAINQMANWIEGEINFINEDAKYIMVAYCEDDDGNDNYEYCEFETSIFSTGQDIYLIENEPFSKHAFEEERGKFIADIQSGRKIKLLTFDIMIYSGDVSFNCYAFNSNTNEISEIKYDKYYALNKVHFQITFQDLLSDQIVVEFKAEINSFFTIEYEINSYNFEQLQAKILSGGSYFLEIDPTSTSKTKNVFLFNKFYKNKNLFLATFNEFNCKFEIKRGNETIDIFHSYAQEIIKNSTSENFQYDIKIIEKDLSNYSYKMCMIDISGYELDSKYDREIVIGENINKKLIFNNDLKKIRLLYPHPYVEEDLVVHINLIDKAVYEISFYANYLRFKAATTSRSQIFYLRSIDFYGLCNDIKLCPIILDIEYYSQIIKEEPMMEVTFRQIKNIPAYLQKNQFKLDFVCGNVIYYLYTDIGKNEIGEITVNFLREYGNVWAKVVKKDQIDAEGDENSRGIYKMSGLEDSLPYNGYTKKLIINPEDTVDCIEGCYLLISIKISQIGERLYEDKLFPFYILTKFTPNNISFADMKNIIIQIDEFVIGNVNIAENEIINEIYEVCLRHDSDYVEFDWQSSIAGLYINIGDKKPSEKKAHFKLLPSGKNTIFSLTKQEILDKAKDINLKIPNDNSLQDISLTIGIWTDKSDSFDTELYSLRVHQPDSFDIILINTDQKIICNPIMLNTEEYRCLFVVAYNDDDAEYFTPLLAYGTSINQEAISYIYCNYIERYIYDLYKLEELKNNIPTFLSSELNSRINGVDFIYAKNLQKGKYMYINIISNKPDPIMLMTSMPVYDYISKDLFEYQPIPVSEQLLFTHGEQLRLEFPVTDSIMVDIESLYGYAEISWKKDPEKVYYLRGMGDRIKLSSGRGIDQLVIHRLVNNEDLNNYKLSSMEDPGFVFYISYHLINSKEEITFEEIKYGKSLEIAFKDADLPIVLYSKIGKEFKDINIAIAFKDNEIDQRGEYSFRPLLISAMLVTEKNLYDSIKDKNLNPSSKKPIIGIYDIALKTGQIFLEENIINSYNIDEKDNPTLYIKIDKNGNINEKIFSKFSIETQISGINDNIIPVENVYHFRKLKNSPNLLAINRLRVDKNRPFMFIQLAFNSDDFDFAITENPDILINTTFLYIEKARGKNYITLKINENKEFYYLCIFKKSNQYNEEYLNNYVFKYKNEKEEVDLFDYKINNSPEISITETKENSMDSITCTFNKLNIKQGEANITYFFKIVDNSAYAKGEELNTIAVTESPYYTVYERNPIDDEGKISLTARGKNLSNWIYLNIIAQVQINDIIEYISYNGKKK